jgi:hypothetical protein
VVVGVLVVVMVVVVEEEEEEEEQVVVEVAGEDSPSMRVAAELSPLVG